MPKKKTHDEYVAELAIKNPTVKVIGKYIDARTPIEHRCLIHDIIWNISPASALRGTGCKECGKIKIGNNLRKTNEQYQQELYNINPNIIVLGEYINSHTPILHKCILDGYIWNASPGNILHGHGCPMCAGNILWTDKQYVDAVNNVNPNIEVIGKYINATTPILHKCKIDGCEWEARPYAILRGDSCPKCTGNKKRTTEEYKQELANINPDIEVIEEYINSTTPILHKCKIDGHVWCAAPNNILNGCGCPECKFRKLSKLFSRTHEEYAKEVENCNSDIEVVGQYVNARTPILHRCKLDGYEWYAIPYNILLGQGCPQCKESSGERVVRQLLEYYDIQYIYQKTFQDCKDIQMLPFDFYLPDYNICIEYDGRQHFEPVDFAGKGEEWAQQQFIKIQCHDEIKNKYCKDNNIPLLRIPYFKNIEEELNNFLFI